MDLSALRTKLRERVGNPDTTDVPDATLTLRVNEALEEILDNYNFHANKITNSSTSTVAGTRNYNLPAAADVLISVRDNTNGVKLRKMDRVKYDELDADSVVVNGKPTSYFRDGNVVYLDPPPDGVYTLRFRYRSATTALSLDADTPSIPLSWHMGIVLLGRYKYWEVLEDGPKMSLSKQTFNDWAESKTDEIAEETKHDYDNAVRLPDLERFNGGPARDFDYED